MGKITSILLVVGCAACVSCTQQSEKDDANSISFSLTGTVTGFKDSTWFFIQNTSGTAVDSAIAIKGQFKFNRQLSDEGYPDLAIFETRDYYQSVVLWLEEKPMTIKIEKGKFQDAVVTGSQTHAEWTDLNKATMPFYRREQDIAKSLNDPDVKPEKKRAMSALTAQLNDSIKEVQINFIKNHPASFLSAFMLDGHSKSWQKDVVSELFDPLTAEVKNSRYGNNVTNFIALYKDISLGDKFADIEQPDVDSVNQRLSNFMGKVILLEFWAGWCGPCRLENPALKKIYHTFNRKGFEIYAVSLDFKKGQWKKAIEVDQLPWTQVSDLKGFKNTAAVMYGVDAIPDNFLIDQNGIIVAHGLHGDKLTKKLKELLN